MNHEFHKAFGSVHATDQMKESTGNFVRAVISKGQRKRPSPLRYAAACCVMLTLALFSIGGYSLYATPVSYISVDINPSVELGLNRLDRVVTVTAYNEDGAAVLKDLNLKNKPYTEAIELLLVDETFGGYLTEDALLSFTVVSEKEEELLTGIRQCHGYAQANAECHGGNAQLVEDAHHNGLSFGKYQAFLELSKYDKTITPEACKELSMRQLRDLIDQYKSSTNTPQEMEPDSGHHGNGHGQGQGNGNGNGQGGQGNGAGQGGSRNRNGWNSEEN